MNADDTRKIADTQFNQLLADLEAGRSDTLRAYPDLTARFHRYSTHNLCLILAQRPDTTHIAGFHTWRRLGRYVKPDERGIAILAPVTRLQVDSDTDERTRVVVTFRVAYVFDVLSRDFATWTAGNTLSRALDYRIGLMIISRSSKSGSCVPANSGRCGGEFEQTCGNRSRRPFRTLAASG